MKTTFHRWISSAGFAAVMIAAAPHASAVAPSLSGVYSSVGSQTQVLVSNGSVTSNSVLNSHQTFSSTFVEATESMLSGQIRVTYEFRETATLSTFVVRYFDPSTGSLLLTFTSEMRISVTGNTNTERRTRTVWTMRMQSSLLGSQQLASQTFDETFTFNLSNFTCIYVNNGIRVTLTRSSTGTGAGQGSPLIPRNPNWTRQTPLNFPIINPNRVVWCDPPYATSFQYDVTPGRKERISSVTLPKGFGPSIQVLAQPSKGGAFKLVGTFKSGAKVNLLNRPGLNKGSAKVLIRNIKPKVDLKKRAPYPLGLTFTGLEQSAAKLRIQAKQITN